MSLLPAQTRNSQDSSQSVRVSVALYNGKPTTGLKWGCPIISRRKLPAMCYSHFGQSVPASSFGAEVVCFVEHTTT